MKIIHNTETAIYTIAAEIKAFAHFFTIAQQGAYILYLIYMIAFVSERMLVPNICLCVGAIVFLIFYIININKIGKEARLAKKTLRRNYRRFKIITQSVMLVITAYNIVIAIHDTSPLTFALAIFLGISWLVNVVIELISLYVESRLELLRSSLASDFEVVTRTAETVSGIFKRGSTREDAGEDEGAGTGRSFFGGFFRR
ncbi:MAG: hypothetical protein IJ515_00815 [Clostridia bacterium]|nr:hypothetical protein [Clostridia bacterium]